MGATFDGDEISNNSIAIMKGSNDPRVIIYPRTIGGILQESGIVDKSILLRSYFIPPSGSSRNDLENFFHLLNEKIGAKEADLIVNGNTYPGVNVRSINYDAKIVKNYTMYDIEFELNEQNDDGDIRQLSVPDMQDFSRGRKMYFTTEMDDGSERTFEFWHNFDLIKNLETEITIKRGINEIGGSAKVIRRGGFENIICHGWIIGPEVNNRQNLEAYFYNIMNGPLGKLGTLVIDGSDAESERTIENTILTGLNMSEETHQTLKYELTFLASLQC